MTVTRPREVSARRLAVLSAVVLLCGAVQAAPAASDDDYTDENRPYEFGFSIEGQQHRHEKKDERGIIMGEFGFITADGVYHVTVYATDENGDFKIISMKNIRLGPPLDQMRTAPRTTTPFSATQPPRATAGRSFSSSSSSSSRPAARLNGVNGCSGCLIPTTTAAPPPPAIGSELQPPFVGAPEQPGRGTGGVSSGDRSALGFGRGLGGGVSGGVQDRIGGGVADRTGGTVAAGALGRAGGSFGVADRTGGTIGGGAPVRAGGSFGGITGAPVGRGSTGNFGAGPGGVGSVDRGGGRGGLGGQQAVLPGQPPVGTAVQPARPVQPLGQRPPFGAAPAAGPSQGVRGAAGQPGTAPPSARPGPRGSPAPFGVQASPPGTQPPGAFGLRPSSRAGAPGGGAQVPVGGGRAAPGEPVREGLPPGVSMQDVKEALLYRFNYTLPYHGHHEEGYRSGNKLGGYFADGLDGAGRSVKYVANEFGYQPNITLVDLRPDHAHTEDDERNAPLLGYKFDWLY